MNKFKLFSFFLLMSFTDLVSAFVTVGVGQDCDFNNLIDAYNDNDLDVRVTSEQVHTNNFVIEKFKFIKGGYDNCLSAQADIVGNQKSKWSGLNAINNTVIEVDAQLAVVATVIIENFEIYDGNNLTASGAGGIKVSGDSNVIIRNSVIYDNNGNEGGGLHVYGEGATLRLENTEVRDNNASGYGGGVYCSNGARLNIDAQSTINNNEATFNGGGLFGGNACEIINSSGESVVGNPGLGISFNQANKGGGIFVQTGALLIVEGGDTSPAKIFANSAFESDQLGGGGLYVAGQNTLANLSNTQIFGNGSDNHGAAMVVTDHASLVMRQSEAGCQYLGIDPCSKIQSNTVQFSGGAGGAGHFSEGADVKISQTVINGNRSNSVSGFVVNDSATLRLEGNLIKNNEANLSSFDTSLIYIGDSMGQAAQVDFLYNTVVNNNVDLIFTANNISSTQVLNVFNSIIWDFGTIFNFNGPALAQIDCSIVHESASLSGNVGAVLTNDPLFINAATGDYRPSLASDAIDFCDNTLFPAEHNDLNNLPRGYDMQSVNNAFGNYDAGAYEYALDIIFRDGFE